MLKLLNIEPENYSPHANKILENYFNVEHISIVNRKKLLNIISNYNIIIVRLKFDIDKEIIDAGTNLSVIVSATTGLDHIDIDYANYKGIEVLSLKDEIEFLKNIPSTSEHTWALLLSLIRKIPTSFESVKIGRWDRDKFRGNNLSGKVLGIIGFGRVGSQVSLYGLAFGMKVITYSLGNYKTPDNVIIKKSLESLIKESDIITIHLPLNSDTVAFISKNEFKCMKENAIIINTSRGEIIDNEILYESLNNKSIFGAALDVLPNERGEDRMNNKLIEYARENNNLLITPHISGATLESMEKTEIFMANKLIKFFENK